ncbi:PLP-dependent transferase [Daedalea quercina L-15889]|uniref:PLP-dependent transferase n=1 Tax=Daedalea quercina L-15889 TaxID=1314783 RepID=A0A165S4P2_9APHY|nr:PLP-dependent transferase [Daedalea quercina L-15889]
MASEKRQKAIDLSHHLSDVSRARETSPLKGLSKFLGKPGLIVLAGGMPSEAYFPFSGISGDALVADSFALKPMEQESSLSWFWKLFSGANKEKTHTITIPKFVEHPAEEVNLAVALQYGTATGLPQLQKFMKDFVDKVYQPAYDDCTIMVHTGNTDGWSRCMQTLMNPGEKFLTEEWTYPSALASSKPYGIYPVPVALDKDGMSSAALRNVLAGWDATTQGKRPHVMYTVPVGQNPVGSTMGAARKKEIYEICVEYDVVIVEDDPYFFLQEGEYVPKASRPESVDTVSEESWLAGLAPSFLKFDYQGRVIRLDTFSKYIAPGSRLGWHTCNPMFAERLERQAETSAQAPCGFGQSLVTKLLYHWKLEGYTRWLHGIATQYTARRDWFIDCLAEELDLKATTSTDVSFWKDCVVYDAYAKPSGGWMMSEKGSVGTKLLSFVPPSAGMFIWLKIHFDNLPAYKRQGEGEESPEIQLWTKIAEAGVLISPGWFFAADVENPPTDELEGHFRISFSNADFATLKKAAQIIARETNKFFKA